MDSAIQRLIDAARSTVFADGDELVVHIAGLCEALQNLDRERQEPRARAIRQLAVDCRGDDGDVEFDDDCAVSESSANGAYVEAWLWIGFDGTPFDKSGVLTTIVRPPT